MFMTSIRNAKCLRSNRKNTYTSQPNKNKRPMGHYAHLKKVAYNQKSSSFVHLCQVWIRSLQPFLWRRSKCVNQSEARAAILEFGSTWKITTLGLDLIRMLHVKYQSSGA